MSKPRISIIIPCRDESTCLERTLCSVIDQEYDNLELLVADGGSADDSVELIQQCAHAITWWKTGADTGPADAVNHALRHATGDIVGILHAGDLYLPGTLDAVAARMTGDDDCHWLAGHSICVDLHDGERGRLDAVAPKSPTSYLMHDSGQLPASAVFYRRSLFEAHGQFDVRFRFAWAYEMHARFILAGVMPVMLGQVAAAHREGEHTDRMQRTLRQGIETIEVAELHGEQLPIKQQYALWRNCDERRRIYTLAEAEMETSLARRHLWQRLLRRPWWLASASYRRMLLQTANHGDGHGRHAA